MPKTKTDTIAAALLDAVDKGVGAEATLARFQGSKGPLYLALASVLDTLRDRMDSAVAELKAKEAERKMLAAEVGALDARRRDVETILARLTEDAGQLEARRAALKGEIEAAARLAGRGFGVDELNRVATLLEGVAADQGAPPEDGVRQFFETMSRYEKIVAFDLEARRAEARAATARAECKRCEAELRRAEAQSRARSEAIAVTERLMAQGVKPDDLPRWERILAAAQLTPTRLGALLRQYGSLAALAHGERAQVEKLRRDATLLRRQVEALKREREGITEELAAVREAGLAAVQAMSADVRRQLADLRQTVAALGSLQHEAGRLEAKLALAQMLEADGEERARRWPVAPLTLVCGTFFGLIAWADAHNDALAPPATLAKRNVWLRYNQLRPTELLVWFSAALSRALEEEAQALGA